MTNIKASIILAYGNYYGYDVEFKCQDGSVVLTDTQTDEVEVFISTRDALVNKIKPALEASDDLRKGYSSPIWTEEIAFIENHLM